MIDKARHPKFDRPPVIEVVHGIQFRRLDFHIGHPGQFHERVRNRYPRVQTLPALPPNLPRGDAVASAWFRVEVPRMDELPRAWFVSEDDTMLVQLQQDRLLLNWRARPESDSYPHYDVVAAEFRRVYAIFEAFVREAEIGEIMVEQCEMTYVNRMGRWTGMAPVKPDEWLRCVSPTVGPEWCGDMLAASFQLDFQVPQGAPVPLGNLSVNATTVREIPSGARALQLDLTVRGAPTPAGSAEVFRFHDQAHDQIVRCFAAITTEDAHAYWGRHR